MVLRAVTYDLEPRTMVADALSCCPGAGGALVVPWRCSEVCPPLLLCTIGAKSFGSDILHAPGAPFSPQSEGSPARGVCPRQNFLH